MTKREKTALFAETLLLPSLVYLSAILFPLSLLISKEIDGPSYVALNALILFCFGVYKLHPRIVEFSVGGNSIKLKETLNEAEQITKDLKEIRRLSLLQFFSTMNDASGNNHVVMKRFYDLLTMYNVMAESKTLISDFKGEITKALSIMNASLSSFLRNHTEIDDNRPLVEQVKSVRDRFKDADEEHFRLMPGHRFAYEFSTCFLLIDEIFDDIVNNSPKPKEIPEFAESYKIQFRSR